MRCDGLPDPCCLPQLNTYRSRWIESSVSVKPSMRRLLHRAPEISRVLCDLDDLLQDHRGVRVQLIDQLYDVRHNLALLLRAEMDAGVASVINDVSPHLVPEESVLHMQVGDSPNSIRSLD